MSLLDSIPGYRDAVERESFIRDAAFLPITQNLCGFEVRQMTLEDFLAFRILKSPFLVGGEPTEADARAFLWRMSPTYQEGNLRARRRVMRKCLAFLAPREPIIQTKRSMRRWAARTVKALELFGNVLIAIREYIGDSLQDWGSHRQAGESVAYF